jgi:hypothetical protein
VAQEGEAKLGVAADEVKALLGDFFDLPDRVGTEVGKLGELETAKDVFGRRAPVPRQALDQEPCALARDPVQHESAAMARRGPASL